MIKLPRLLLVISSGLLAGCLGHVQTDGEWEADVPENESFDRVIILGLSSNASARCDFEMFLRTQIELNGTQAQASCLLMKTTDEINRENIEKIIADYQADALLATVLVGSEQRAEEGGDRETRGGIYLKPEGYGYDYYDRWYRGGYGVYGIPVVYGEWQTAPVITSVQGEISIRSMLYDTNTDALIYEVMTKAEDLHSREDALASITPPIAARLRNAGLIQ